MEHAQAGPQKGAQQPRARKLLMGLTIAAFAAGLIYLLVGEHRVHMLGWLPFLLLLLCPLLHMGMHGGHGGHGGGDADGQGGGQSHQHKR